MDEREIIFSHALDVRSSCLRDSMISFTNFFSFDEVSYLRQRERELTGEADLFYYGGYEDAERKLLVFAPDYYGIENIEEFFLSDTENNPVCAIKIEKDRFSSLNHRDYLGSLMGLGIKREMLGDIKVTDKGCTVFALKSISGYICENLVKVGRGSVHCTVEDVSECYEQDEKNETAFSSVASLRLDNIVSAAFNLSRSNAVIVIEGGTVYVNSVQIIKKDYLIREGDKVVLRGKGKAVVEEILGESKKGRIHINIKKYR